MIITVNQCSFSGRLTKEPTLKDLGRNNLRVCNCSMAINNQEKKGDEYVDSPLYINLEAWGIHADILSRIKKGQGLAAYGSLYQQSYEKDGVVRTTLVLKCDAVIPVSESKKDEASAQAPKTASKTKTKPSDDLQFTNPDDDVPF